MSSECCKLKNKHNTPTWVKVPCISWLSCGCMATAGAETTTFPEELPSEGEVLWECFRQPLWCKPTQRNTNLKGMWPLLDTSSETHMIWNAAGSLDASTDWLIRRLIESFICPRWLMQVFKWQRLKGRTAGKETRVTNKNKSEFEMNKQ